MLSEMVASEPRGRRDVGDMVGDVLSAGVTGSPRVGGVTSASGVRWTPIEQVLPVAFRPPAATRLAADRLGRATVAQMRAQAIVFGDTGDRREADQVLPIVSLQPEGQEK